VHTLNGTAVTARVLLAIMENTQDAEGSWSAPAALKEFGAP
jgi:seryl-tRNA synthetase